MRVLFMMSALVLVLLGTPVAGQDDAWSPPLNAGEMPANAPLLPSPEIMPALPLPDPLVPGTLFFSIQDFGGGYHITHVTLDYRLHAYNISYQYGVHPISPNGQYAIFTAVDSAEDFISCGILDMLTLVQVDQFQTAAPCDPRHIHWSPDSTQILFQTRDSSGRSALALRQNGQTTMLRPVPVAGVDLGGQPLVEERDYFATGWVSEQVITFEIGIGVSRSEQLFATLSRPEDAYPVFMLDDAVQNFVPVLPSQTIGTIHRSYRLFDTNAAAYLALANEGEVVSRPVLSPDGSRFVYWVETASTYFTTYPLRLVVFDPQTRTQSVLLQFDGPRDRVIATRPGQIAWNHDAIYFDIAQQEGTTSSLVMGTYRIQPNGTNLEFVTPEFLFYSLAP